MYCRIPGLPSPIPRVQPSPSSSSGSTGSPLLGHPHTSPPTVSPLSSLIARICSRPPWLCLKSTSGEHRLTVPIRPGTGLCVFPQASWDPGWGGGDESSVLPVCRMKLPCGFFLLWFGLVGSLAENDPSLKGEESYSDWGLRHLRGSFESVNSYVDSFMELLGGKNGVCQYRCRYGEYPGAFSGVGVGEGVGSWAAQQVTSVLHQVGQVTRLSKSGVVTSEIQADNKFLRGAWGAFGTSIS